MQNRKHASDQILIPRPNGFVVETLEQSFATKMAVGIPIAKSCLRSMCRKREIERMDIRQLCKYRQ